MDGIGTGRENVLVPRLMYLFGTPINLTKAASFPLIGTMVFAEVTIKLAQGLVYLSTTLILAFRTIVGSQNDASTIKKFRPNTLKFIF